MQYLNCLMLQLSVFLRRVWALSSNPLTRTTSFRKKCGYTLTVDAIERAVGVLLFTLDFVVSRKRRGYDFWCFQ